jgi:hypothetical protein
MLYAFVIFVVVVVVPSLSLSLLRSFRHRLKWFDGRVIEFK